MPVRWIVILILMNVVWAGTYSATKSLMADAPFFLVTSIRYLVAVPPLVYLAARRYGLQMPLRDAALCALIGVMTFTLCPYFLYAGISLSRAADAAVIAATEPLLVAVGAYYRLGEKTTRRMFFGIGLSLFGIFLLSESWLASGRVHAFGSLLILVAVAFEAGYSVIGKELLTRHAPMKILASAILFACVVNVPILCILDYWPRAREFSAVGWLLLIGYLALFCTAFGYTLWFMALRRVSAASVAVTIYAQPVAGLLIAWYFVDETPRLFQVLGSSVVLFGVAVALAPWKKPTITS